jgi:hypothetical protein
MVYFNTAPTIGNAAGTDVNTPQRNETSHNSSKFVLHVFRVHELPESQNSKQKMKTQFQDKCI